MHANHRDQITRARHMTQCLAQMLSEIAKNEQSISDQCELEDAANALFEACRKINNLF